MKRMGRQIRLRFLLLFSVLLLILVIISVTALYPLQLLLRRHSINEAFRKLEVVDLELLVEEPASAGSDLEDVLSTLGFYHIHYLIMDEGFTVLASDEGTANSLRRSKQLRKKEELFSTSPRAVREVEEFGEQAVLYGRIASAGGDYLVCLYIRLAGLRGRCDVATGATAATAVLAVLIGWISLYICQRNMYPPGEALIREVDELAAGEYNARVMQQMPDNDLRPTAWKLNRIAERLNRYRHDLDNYAYLFDAGKMEEPDEERIRRETVAQVTHQLKTPLAILSSQLELVQEETDSDKKNYYFASMLEEIDKMSMLISTILKNAGGKKTGVNHKPRRFSLSELLEELAVKYEGWISANGITFTSRIVPGIDVNADPAFIEQAVHNYVMNAVSHTKSGKEIRLALRKEAHGFCVLSVHNEGERIPDADKERIWGHRVRGDAGESSTNVGLGLYIVSDIMKRSGGECGFINDESGVEFYMRLGSVD